MRIHPFDALRPRPDLVERVAAVPYDVVDTREAAALAHNNPYSLLHVSRPEIDLPEGTSPHAEAVYARARDNFNRLVNNGALMRDGEPCLYVYRQVMEGHAQRGIVTCCHIEDYEKNIIRRHEKTRADKEDDRTRHVQVLGANTGPVFLMYREQAPIDRIVAGVEAGVPLYDFTAPDGIRHTVWRVRDTTELVRGFEKVPLCYVADGHHRAAAAVRAGVERRKANTGHTGEEEYNWFLAVLFPAGQLRILPYHRVVKDINGLSSSAFLDAVRKRFTVTTPAAAVPPAPCNAAMYLEGKWHGLGWKLANGLDPLESLDVSYLNKNVLEPVLGIKDFRTDPRIDFVGGVRGTKALEERVNKGEAAVAFSMYPVTVDQVMRISDAGLIMPPKSTWFEPKLRSGLLIHTM